MPSGIYKRTKPPWNKDKKRSEQTKRKIRKKMKGRHSSLKTEFKQGSIPWNKDTKGVMKVNKTSFKKGEHFSVSTEFKKGEKKSKEFKKICRRNVLLGITGMKGREHSENSKKYMSEIKIGERNSNYIDGRSKENHPYPDEWREILKESIRQRDNYICQICGIHQDELKGWNRQLDVHHKDYDKNNLDPDNLITLCRGCHSRTNYHRNYWIRYFNDWKY